MSTLIVVGYEDKHHASDVLSSLRRLEWDSLVDLNEAISVCMHENGGIHFEQTVDYEDEGTGWGILWGTLIASLLGAPFAAGSSAAAGAAVLVGDGAVEAEAVRKAIGLDPDFVRQVRDTIWPGGSAVLALVSNGDPDVIAKELRVHGGTLLRSRLTSRQDAELRRILANRRG